MFTSIISQVLVWMAIARGADSPEDVAQDVIVRLLATHPWVTDRAQGFLFVCVKNAVTSEWRQPARGVDHVLPYALYASGGPDWEARELLQSVAKIDPEGVRWLVMEYDHAIGSGAAYPSKDRVRASRLRAKFREAGDNFEQR